MAEKKSKSNIVHVSGKRKRATARVTLKAGKGIVKINNFLLDHYKPEVAKMRILEPIYLAGEIAKKVDININVNGGGWNAQADACRTGIGKALAQFNPLLKKTFLDYDRAILINDVRFAESSKPNDSKPRKCRQKSYR
ncbi:30S ribosomal protein S9 [Candidatus Woesearchaeota archaeon]|nr:30S ribosomal protein S9 [Candidatus Woesearchaeota archaeon]